MSPNLDPSFLHLILTALLIVAMPICFCQDDHLYQTCGQSFQCGNISKIGYPFWGGNRPASCGHPRFELNCGSDTPRLNMASLSYRVLAIDANRTLKIARDDLWTNLCPRYLFDTTLIPSLFNFYSVANDQSIALYYDCTLNQLPALTRLRNQFRCKPNGTATWNFFQYPISQASDLGGQTTCTSNISVRVNKTAAQTLSFLPETSKDILKDALQSGFWIQWTADEMKCNKCNVSGGLCGHNPGTGMFACHCSDRSHDISCIGAVNVNQTPNGTANGSEKVHNDKQKNPIIGAFASVAGILLLGFIIFYITRQCRLHQMDQTSNPNVENFLSLAPKRYSYNELKRITKSFTDKLGEGGYGIVYKGWLPDGPVVAVKVLAESDDSSEEFINEVTSISRTSHVNIVNLLGFCHDRRKRALVYEFMPNKSLDKYLHKSGDSQLHRKRLYDIAVSVARGLEYLHRGCNTRIVHFDIKPHNILLDKDFCPKISDFGLAKLFKKDQSVISVVGTRGTAGYIAPEVFSRNFGPVSSKSDVYSYGMVLLEMSGARKIDEIEATQSSENYFFDKIFKYSVLKDDKSTAQVTEVDEETERKMMLVGLWCTQTSPSDRPSMSKVVEMLEGSLESIQIPPKPFLSPSEFLSTQFTSTFSIDIVTQNLSED